MAFLLTDVQANTLDKTLANALADTLAVVKCEKLSHTLNKGKALALSDALAECQKKSAPETLEEH